MPNDKGKKRVEDDNGDVHEPLARAKRVRVSQACNECRKKKERCDGVQPRCGPCSSLDRTCCFDAQPRRRGLPTGYVRAVEVLLGLMFHSIDGIEHCATSILRGETSLPAFNREQPSFSPVTSLADSWRRSGTMKELERLLAGVDPGDECELSTRDLYEKLEGAFMNRLIVDNNCYTRIELPSPHRITSPPVSEQLAPDLAPETPSPVLPVAYSTPSVPFLPDYNEPMDLPHDWSRLLERYFTDTHTWFPVAPKHDLLRQAFSIANSISDMEGQKCVVSDGDRAAVFATLAYACYRDALSVYDTPGQFGDLLDPSEKAQHEPPSLSLAKRLQNEASSVLTKGKERSDYDSGHVQALLVLTILQIDQGLLKQAWITIGQAVYVAVILNIIPASQRSSHVVIDDKLRRLFLGIYILETLIAYTLERRPYLQRSDLAKIGPLPVDSIEEWEAWRPLDTQDSSTRNRTHTPGRSLSTFNTFLDLVTLLNNQAHGLSSLSETLGHFQSWRTIQPQSRRNAIVALNAVSIDTPPQILNITLASLSIDAMLQIKCVLQESSPDPALPSAIPASAHRSLETIAKHRRLVKASQACPLMTVYLSMIGSHMNMHEKPYALSAVQQQPGFIHQSTGLTNSEKSLDYLQFPTPASCTISAQPMLPITSELLAS
jgi:hypothetical protein